MSWIRLPAVAGQFYPAAAGQLRAMIDGFLDEAGGNGQLPRALIAPHAGYIYSGPIAASAYAHLTAGRETIHRVVLLGPAHRVPVRGLAASSAAGWSTPLGVVPLDHDVIRDLTAMPPVQFDDEAHALEHSLEVHLPFLQTVLADFKLVPLVIGDAAPDEVAEVLERFAGDRETLVVISSDLSHYFSYEQAGILDQETSQAIERLQALRLSQACGQNAINGLLVLARRHGWHVRTVDLRNSGDTAGPRDQVVGYGAWLFN